MSDQFSPLSFPIDRRGWVEVQKGAQKYGANCIIDFPWACGSSGLNKKTKKKTDKIDELRRPLNDFTL